MWHSENFGEIEPDGSGSGAKKQIDQLCLIEGNTIEYVYDFGDDIRHVITLEKIVEPEMEAEYPHVTSKNKPKYRYCEVCEEQMVKTIATWFCIECSEEKQREVLLCKNCLDKEHEEHYAYEILY